MLSFTLQANAQVPLIANVVDQLGQPAHPDSISWSVADESVAGIDSTIGGSVNLIAHAEGSTTVAVTVGSLTTLLHVTVAPVVASAVSIEIGAPVAKAIVPSAVEEPHAAEPHAPVEHASETAADSAPVEAATHTEEAHPAETHAAEAHRADAQGEGAHMGEETGREAAHPAAPPEQTSHDSSAAA